MHSVPAAYAVKHFDNTMHRELCCQAYEYANLAGLALELNDAEVFKRIREKILLVIDQDHEFQKLELSRHERTLGDEGNATSPLDSESEVDDNHWIQDGRSVESNYEAFETASIRNAREERQKSNPSLVILHKIWDYTREDLWGFM